MPDADDGRVDSDTTIERWMMSSAAFRRFVDLLQIEFDEVIGPVVADGAVRLRRIESADALPIGVTDEQEAATYRVHHTGSSLRFSYAVGPDSLKSIAHPPRSPVWTMRRRDGSIVVEQAVAAPKAIAVLGARACDIRALSVLERTQAEGAHPDPGFVARRQGLFLVAVDCTHPAPTCFCATAGEGPSADREFDIALTELNRPHTDVVEYLVRVGTDRGRELIGRLSLPSAPAGLVARADVALRRAADTLVREMPANAEGVVQHSEHPHWDVVADRCLTCGNCTAVCPTCFCTDMDDEVSIDGDSASRTRVWDSCFSMEYSHLGAGPHRASPKSRYRQWLSHKLGTWHDQFGESGCVGCGRCITWCPVGIDLTAEVESLGRTAEVR